MQNSLFVIELPLVNTNEELEQIKKANLNCDPYFIVSGCIKERREKSNLNSWRRISQSEIRNSAAERVVMHDAYESFKSRFH
ncbi:MAG: hypothetical protein A2748_01210 [Candidatus Wildermuthbacteria bacterium RIFCSPHIGHO2_01_FULL_45_20]|uniref:Uncharacterized protein n=1 Tax=Candidatus Wildermuthbacteria bacterium RIFCSPHIGHO2_02_FULL_45_25 TaxID=1802450 RepID=A0A1G2R5L9_9BACT|nr:MAG: hypothetical protein A2748_01210 [Candidatus Wildermuthbacteria bacterium RIFCSPHIGHO2_01_FULL_45_20]OHA67858.1 MAG: hypothetical protein A3C04_02895 [Candidatus Wildermuthbacteria bacterium RIFCSPHIGHO2_02_FULL_45_25]